MAEPLQQNPDKPAIIEKIGILAGQWYKKHGVIVGIWLTHPKKKQLEPQVHADKHRFFICVHLFLSVVHTPFLVEGRSKYRVSP